MTVTVVVLDSVGVGALPDAGRFGDAGAHTLDHTLAHAPVSLPNLQHLGLGNIEGIQSLSPATRPSGAYGRMLERSPGKDTTTGHWEFVGVALEQPFRTFERFPDEVMGAFDHLTGRGHLGNRPASGTEIITQLGEKHLTRGEPIVYTSADSVFQVAAHVDVVPLETLYRWCQGARELLVGEYSVARVIARPFIGHPGAFERLGSKRRDFSVSPPHRTVLEELANAGREVVAVGKIGDIYNGVGISREIKAKDNNDGVEQTISVMSEHPHGLVFCNLVEFDSLFGHRRDPEGYSQALRDFDELLPRLTAALQDEDVLMLVSDHGNDPTWRGTDHTREYGLLLGCGPKVAPAPLGTRNSFADVGATVADLLDVEWTGIGESFATLLRGHNVWYTR
ncbi:MAG: phosphopentomutase [Trueperaceae bacterium]